MRQSAPECKIMQFNMANVQKVQKAIENDYLLVIITKVYYINKVFCICLGFAYLDVKIGICL